MLKLKFKKDEKWIWIFGSETFKAVDINTYGIEPRKYNEICRFEYENYYSFSDYDKPRTEFGEVANFSLTFQCEDVYNTTGGVCVKGEKYWREIRHIGNFKTKKEMLECIDYYMNEAFIDGWTPSGQCGSKGYNTWKLTK